MWLHAYCLSLLTQHARYHSLLNRCRTSGTRNFHALAMQLWFDRVLPHSSKSFGRVLYQCHVSIRYFLMASKQCLQNKINRFVYFFSQQVIKLTNVLWTLMYAIPRATSLLLVLDFEVSLQKPPSSTVTLLIFNPHISLSHASMLLQKVIMIKPVHFNGLITFTDNLVVTILLLFVRLSNVDVSTTGHTIRAFRLLCYWFCNFQINFFSDDSINYTRWY